MYGKERDFDTYDNMMDLKVALFKQVQKEKYCTTHSNEVTILEYSRKPEYSRTF